MPPSNILKEITKLTGASNWNVWKVDMKMYFMGEEVWKIVSAAEGKPALESNPDNLQLPVDPNLTILPVNPTAATPGLLVNSSRKHGPEYILRIWTSGFV